MEQLDQTVIVAFAFGSPGTLSSNRRLGKIASEKAWQLKLAGQEVSVYTQKDIPIEDGIRVQYAVEKPGQPPSTLRLARGAVRWTEKQDTCTEICVVAATPHIKRCMRDVMCAAIEARVSVCSFGPCKEIEQYPENSCWGLYFSAQFS